MEPGGADVQHGHEVGGLARGGEHGAHAPFQGGNLLLYGVQGGVGKAGVEKAFRLQIEKVAHLLGALVNVSGALHDGGHTGLPVFWACSPRGYKGYRLKVLHVVPSFPQVLVFPPASLRERQAAGKSLFRWD